MIYCLIAFVVLFGIALVCSFSAVNTANKIMKGEKR